MVLVIGVDAGGTSTRAALADDRGRVLSYARSGAGNPTSAGPDVAVGHIVEACVAAVSSARAEPDLVMVTLAGGGAFDVAGAVRERLGAAGVTADVRSDGDVLSAYFSATAEADGYLVLSGTGATAARVEGGSLTLVCDGTGWLVGDGGSGFWIGREVVRAVAADLDARGPRTSLTTAVLAELERDPAPELPGVPHPALRTREMWALMRRVYDRRPVEVASFAPLALAAAEAGDEVARRILDEALAELLATCDATVRDDGRPVVLAGGLLHDDSPLGRGIRARHGDRCRRAHEGTAGAVMLALRAIGGSPDESTREQVLTSLETARTGAGTTAGGA